MRWRLRRNCFEDTVLPYPVILFYIGKLVFFKLYEGKKAQRRKEDGQGVLFSELEGEIPIGRVAVSSPLKVR